VSATKRRFGARRRFESHLALAASSVGLGEVIGDGLRIRIIDRRVVDLDHLRDLGFPERFAAIRRLRVDVINRVARQAVVLRRLHTRPWSKCRGLFGKHIGQDLCVTRTPPLSERRPPR
jgi:hypothetical protein